MADGAGETAGTDGGEIVVTGSRVARSGFEAPTPVTIVGEGLLQARGSANVADALNELPAFRPSSTPSASTQVALTAGQNFADLRGLGPNRTLVLVDSRRFVPVNPTGQVDLNLIPTALVERVEVVTGGASAAYGSDAVSGVVNFIFKKKIEGLQGSVQYGLTERGDNEEFKASLATGISFADDRGRILIAGEYSDTRGVRFQRSRGWGRKGYHLIANPAFNPGNGQPQRLIAADAQLSYATFNGLINSGPLRGTEFLPGGTTRPFTYGTSVGSSYMIGGSGVNPDLEKPLSYPVERKILYIRPSYDLNDSLTLFADLSYGNTVGGGDAFGGIQSAITIRNDNAYLPASVRDQMAAANVTTFTFGRLTRDLLLRTVVNTKTYRAVGGVEGRIGADWTWNAYYEYGRTRYRQNYFNNTISANLTRALDAVADPATGRIVCRSTLTTPTDGCVPINLFGEGSASAAAVDYVTGTQDVVTRLTEQVVAASMQGKPFSTWAGPVSLAFGAEYRSEKSVQISDPISQARGFALSNPQSFSGRISVKEAFAELVVPLAEDMPLLRSLELNAAGRLTDYSTSGSVETWKLGLSWKPIDRLRLRGTLSRDIRAPNIAELFSPSALLFFTAIDPANNNQQVFIQRLTSGNSNLKPEKADTKTLGLIYSPGWIEGLTASIDYYDIKIRGAVATLAPQQIIDRCFAGQAALCGFVNRNAANQLTSVAVQQINLASIKTRGIDFEARYRLPLEHLSPGWDGSLTFNLLVSYLDTLTQSDGVTTFENAGVVGTESSEANQGGTPHWRATGSVTYDRGPLRLFAQGRWIGGGLYSSAFTANSINDNSVAGQFLANVSAEYRFDIGGREVSLFGLVNNLFDKAPPVDPGVFIYATATNPVLYDVFGRTFAMGLRFKL